MGIGEELKDGDKVESLGVSIKKSVRRKKGERREYQIDKSKKKFVIDFSTNSSLLEKLWKVMEQANNREFGREIVLMDLVTYWLEKTNEKAIVEIQDQSLSEKDKVLKHFKSSKLGKNEQGDIWEYLVKELKIK